MASLQCRTLALYWLGCEGRLLISTKGDDARRTLRFRLRDATAEAHRDLEATMRVADRCRTREAYIQILSRLWGLYGPLEAALEAVVWEGTESLVRLRAKTGLLVADLEALGFCPRQLGNLPRATRLPRIDGPLDILGVLYVLEGATLGGQVVLSWLTEHLDVCPETGARFYASYGGQIGVMWRAFLEVLERLGADPAAAERIERAALETFQIFETWVATDPAVSPTGGHAHAA